MVAENTGAVGAGLGCYLLLPMTTSIPTPTPADLQERVGILLEALPYIRRFAGATVVIKYGGAAMTAPELKASFAQDVALLKLVGMNPVIVHGGGKDISRYSDLLGLEVRFVDGLRVTDAPTMEIVKMVLVGKINKEIVAQLQVAGVRAVGLSGDDGGLIRATKAASGNGELGFVGDVESIDSRVLTTLAEFVPVVASVGVDAEGQSYNINADTVAGALAASLRAQRVLFLTDVPGLMRDVADPDSVIARSTLAEIDEMVGSGAIDAGMIPKLEAVRNALRHGVESASIIDGRVPHSVLMEIFTDNGCGTQVLQAR